MRLERRKAGCSRSPESEWGWVALGKLLWAFKPGSVSLEGVIQRDKSGGLLGEMECGVTGGACSGDCSPSGI